VNSCPNSLTRLSRLSDVLCAAFALAVVFLFVFVPVPARVLDVGLTVNIALAIGVTLMVSSARRTLELSCFPAMLLFLTLFRLSLNVASTRLILTQGTGFEGIIIRNVGDMMVAGSLPVGITQLVVLIAIQFLVITKGAERMAEVAARFTLDGMQMKMMAVQEQLDKRQLSSQEAEERLDQIQREADFYGGMDGASRFVKGEAIASVLILAVNALAGCYEAVRGVAGDPMSVVRAYMLLTVGDGLVTLLPSLFVSVATALLIAKNSSSESVTGQAVKQFTAHTRPLAATAGLLALLLVVLSSGAGMNKIPFLLVAMALAVACWKGLSREEASEAQPEFAEFAEDPFVRPLELRLAVPALGRLSEQGRRLERELRRLRAQLQSELGLQVPGIPIRADDELKGCDYILELRGAPVARGKLPEAGSSEVDALEVALAALLAPRIRDHADSLLRRQDLEDLLTEVRKLAPAVFEAVAALDRGVLLEVFRRLLEERVSIRDRVAILEAIASGSQQSTEPVRLTETVRAGIPRHVTGRLLSSTGELNVMTLSPDWERELTEALCESDCFVILPPDRLHQLIKVVTDGGEAFEAKGLPPVLETTAKLRRPVRDLLYAYLPEFTFLSHREISREVRPKYLLCLTCPETQPAPGRVVPLRRARRNAETRVTEVQDDSGDEIRH
jgi:flagellar biosynthesis protein FlhA